MKKHIYTIIGILVPLGPLALSFDEKVYFFQYLAPVLGAILVAGSVFIVWDIFAVRKKHWSFNDSYVGSLRIARLPAGEWLFFMGVPYACIFIYETVTAYFGDSQIQGYDNLFLYAGYGLVLPGLIFGFLQKRAYTSWVAFAVSGAILMVSLFSAELWQSTAFWAYIGLCHFAFLLVNGIYVNLPTIYYNQEEFSGIRIIGIPCEDFLYNFSYLVLVLFSYLQFKEILAIP